MLYGVETDFAKLFVECMLKECDLLKSELFFQEIDLFETNQR